MTPVLTLGKLKEHYISINNQDIIHMRINISTGYKMYPIVGGIQ